MRILILIAALFTTNLLAAQTIDQKLEKLAAKGYINKDYISSIKQIILLKEDSVTEGSVLFYIYSGDLNFNSSGVLKDDLTKMKKATKSNPDKVLKDMVAVGLIENDSSVAWIRREMKKDTTMFLKNYVDIYSYLNSAGEYEDAMRPYRLTPVLTDLNKAGLLSDSINKDLFILLANKKLNNIWDVFSRCKNFKVVSQLSSTDIAEGVRQRIMDAASLVPDVVVSNVTVRLQHINSSVDSIYVSLQNNGRTFNDAFSVLSGSDEWDQLEVKRVYQVVNKAAASAGSPKRIYEITVDAKISGANNRKALCAIDGEQHFALQQLQRAKSGTMQLFRIFPN